MILATTDEIVQTPIVGRAASKHTQACRRGGILEEEEKGFLMSRVEAIFRQGVFQPLEPVHLAEEQRVRLSIEPAGGSSPQAWLEEVRKLQALVVARQGPLPDSTPDIAADRLR